MNLIDNETFTQAWSELDKTSDPKAIHEAFEADQEAEDERALRQEDAA